MRRCVVGLLTRRWRPRADLPGTRRELPEGSHAGPSGLSGASDSRWGSARAPAHGLDGMRLTVAGPCWNHTSFPCSTLARTNFQRVRLNARSEAVNPARPRARAPTIRAPCVSNLTKSKRPSLSSSGPCSRSPVSPPSSRRADASTSCRESRRRRTRRRRARCGATASGSCSSARATCSEARRSSGCCTASRTSMWRNSPRMRCGRCSPRVARCSRSRAWPRAKACGCATSRPWASIRSASPRARVR